ncbi:MULTISPECIES: sensor histidine kinase [Prauserella salsuginis group]|uniref:Sensor histidine kinase n=1 Tax=Prauserella salsuginis TaxID=387889 RepID=A0ABW6G7L7_9PSEU|nr:MULTISPECIES: histidine kinase [Prauserella salsuginis group]MCR3719525.1 two-component system, NarL family, sensor histidine kinase DesK [Prauserella flava]MCR3735461.1 two-component system, NarL family, sensor histidine kinase DesK [Prauserella salsuginis]
MTTTDDQSDAQTRLRKINLTVLMPPVLGIGILLIIVDTDTWLDRTVLAVGVATAGYAFVHWAHGGILRVAVPCLALTAGVWLYGALASDMRTAFFPLLVVGPFVVSRLPRRRIAATVALTVGGAAIGALRLLVTTGGAAGTLLADVAIPGGLLLLASLAEFPNKRFYDVVTDLERARYREAELAVAGERMRFASDLHDIQGHTLHVVKLKAALARRLVATDPKRAEDELQEIHDLVGETITRTKELAYAQRRLNLTAELENAKNLFEAAGIGIDIDRRDDPAPGQSELLGQVLRETTTNILRHAQAERVRITLSASGITIVNDGAQDTRPVLSGLATLTDRISDAGGALTVQQQGGRFVTAAEFGAAAPVTGTEIGEEEPA